METLQDSIKNVGFDKLITFTQDDLLNHFILKVLEHKKVDPELIDALYKQDLEEENFAKKIGDMPHFELDACYETMERFLDVAIKPNSIQKIPAKNVIDPDRFDFSAYSKESMLEEVPDTFSDDLFMKKFSRLKTVHGHQKLQNFHENLEPAEQTIPLYNVIYDNTGELLITADDNGLIKVWSTFNLQLLFQLRGHQDLIHALEITPDNYLISCSQDKKICVWDLKTQTLFNIFSQPYQNSILTVALYKKDLISLSENGEICIYFDFMQYDTTRTYQLVHERVKEASCLAVSNFGEIVMGTSDGNMYVYESLEQLKYKKTLKYHIWDIHTKSVHTIVFSKNSDRFMTGSLDGTLNLFDWKPNINVFDDHKPKIVLSFDDTKVIKVTQNAPKDSKCWTNNFSRSGTYAIGAFGKRNRKNLNLDQQMQSNIVVYSYEKNKVIHRLSEDTCGIPMNNEYYVIEAHPIKEEIIFTGDFDGQVIIWNIELGIVLNLFKELAMPLQNPHLETPVIDGRFSPDGLQFVVSTYYGHFTLYGYGPKQIFNYSYYDQFGEKDYIDFNITPNNTVVALNGSDIVYMQDVQLDQKLLLYLEKM